MKWLILIALSLVWGSSFILIKKSLLAFDPIQVSLLRISVSAIALTPFIYIYRSLFSPKIVFSILAVGLFGTAFPSYLYPLAQTHVDSNVAGVLNSMTPLFTFLIGVLFFKTQFDKRKLSGVLIGLLGVVILIIGRNGWSFGSNTFYSIVIIIATISYAISANTVHTFLKKTPALFLTSLAMFMIGLPAILGLFQTNFIEVMGTHPDAQFSLLCAVLLGFFGTALASIAFFYLVQMTDALFASTVAYAIPVVALIFGIFDGEMINEYLLVGLSLIMAGVYLNR